jgi:hypothetical protein
LDSENHESARRAKPNAFRKESYNDDVIG